MGKPYEMMQDEDVNCEECLGCGSQEDSSSMRKMMAVTIIALLGLLVATSKISKNGDAHNENGSKAVKKVEEDEVDDRDIRTPPKPNNIFALDGQ